mmetsp:Transcript_28175/g.52615  ORF Transcript_28175/g.52615 Transcript_28175/m.52615 type:complete len:256 (+) Transcript_28175:2382-3149(+)
MLRRKVWRKRMRPKAGLPSSSSSSSLWPKFMQFTLKGASGASPELRDFIRYSDASNLAAALLDVPGAQVAFHADDLFIKETGCQERTNWHRDSYSEPFQKDRQSGIRMINLWMPLAPLNRSDSIRILTGSHAWPSPGSLGDDPRGEAVAEGILGSGWREKLASMLPLSERMSREEREGIVASFAIELLEEALGAEFENIFPVMSWELEPGDVVAFHRQALHSAKGNSMEWPRIALSTRWGTRPRTHMTTDARFDY